MSEHLSFRNIIHDWIDEKYSALLHDMPGAYADSGEALKQSERFRVIRYYDGDIYMHHHMIATVRDYRIDPHIELYPWDEAVHTLYNNKWIYDKIHLADPELFKKLADHIRRWRKNKGYR